MLKNVSASQAETVKSCLRLYRLRYIDKLPTPQSPAQEKGEDIHSSAEIYLNTGSVPEGIVLLKPRFQAPVKKDLSYVAPFTRALIPILPAPMGPELVTEHEINFKIPSHGVTWRGFIDFADSASKILKIGDIKSTSDLKYAKTEANLPTDIQMVSYGQYGYQELGHRGPTELSHHYVQTRLLKTRLPNTRLVRVTVTQSQVQKEWEKILPLIDKMQAVALAPNAQAVTPTGVANRHCMKYDGCAFLAECGLAKPQMGRIFAGLNKIEEDVVANFKDKLKNKGYRGTLPPDAPSRTVDEEEIDDEEEAQAAPVKKKSFKDKIRAKAAEVEAEEEEELAEEAEEEDDLLDEETEEIPQAAPKRRGRPVGSKNRPKGREAPQNGNGHGKRPTPVRAAPAEEEVEEEDGEGDTHGVAQGGPESFTLYIDCGPLKYDGHPILFEDWFSPIKKELNRVVQEESKLPDYRLLAFSEEKAALYAAIQKNIKNLPPAMVMSSTSQEAKDARAILTPYASQVVCRHG